MVVKLKNRFNDCCLDNLNINENNAELIDYCRSIAEDLDTFLNSGANILITGTCGVGKTYIIKSLLNTISNHIIEIEEKKFNNVNYTFETVINKRRVDIKYITIYDLIDNLRKKYKNEEVDNTFQFCDILAIDEIGVQLSTDAERQILYDIINYRWENFKNTIIISNLAIKSNDKQTGIDRILGARILDRLVNKETKIFSINGKSMR